MRFPVRARSMAAATVALGLLAGLQAVGAGTAGAASPAAHTFPHPPNPAETIAPCTTLMTWQASTWLHALDCAQTDLGLAPLPISVAQVDSLTPAEQIFAITNLERLSYGEEPASAMTAALDARAQVGADNATWPTPHGIPDIAAWGSVADGSPTALEADYGLLYQDGGDITPSDDACTPWTAGQCWGTRERLLEQFGACPTGQTQTLLMGAATAPNGGSAILMDENCGAVPSTVTVTWAQVQQKLAGVITLT